MPALTKNEFDIAILALSWIGGFLPRFLADAQPRRFHRWTGWTWVQSIGLALVLSPFVRMLLNVYVSIDALFVFTVLEPVSREALWRGIGRTLLYSFAFPAVGLLILHNAVPRWKSRRAPAKSLPQALAAHGLGPRHSWQRDALRGIALFFCIGLAYAVAYGISRLFSPELAGGVESDYWRNITLPLIVLVSVAAGLTEEFLFRGLLLRRLARWLPWSAAAVLQALFFGLIHSGYGTWTHVLGPFAFGLGMAWVARILGIVPAMLLHAQVNMVFFAVDVSDVLPSAWALVAALLALNLAAAWATRLDAVRLLWKSLLRRFDEVPDEAPPATAR